MRSNKSPVLTTVPSGTKFLIVTGDEFDGGTKIPCAFFAWTSPVNNTGRLFGLAACCARQKIGANAKTRMAARGTTDFFIDDPRQFFHRVSGWCVAPVWRYRYRASPSLRFVHWHLIR